MVIGKARKWLNEKNFGFVMLVETGEDVFVHGSKLPPGVTELIRGEEVRLEVEQRADGKLRAVRIELQR